MGLHTQLTVLTATPEHMQYRYTPSLMIVTAYEQVYHDLVRVHYSVQTMSNGQYCLLTELFSYDVLNDGISSEMSTTQH